MRKQCDLCTLVVTPPQGVRLGLWQRRSRKLPQRQRYPLHGNLADNLLSSEPLAAPLEDSITVEAILQAAARSKVNNSLLETLDD